MEEQGGRNITMKPTDDFFQYVNSDWIKNNPIPPDEGRWGSFDVLCFDVEQQLKQIFDEIVATDDFSLGSAEQKIRDFYRTAMDVEKRNRDGVAPLAEIFNRIDAIASKEDLARVIGMIHSFGTYVFWAPFAEQDEKNSEVVALHLWQAGLNLPDRDYYLQDDEKNKKIRADYLEYIKDLFGFAGMALSDDEAGFNIPSFILEFETRLARASLARVELRDVEKNYHKLTIGEFTALAPRVSFMDYLKAIGDPRVEYLIVGQPGFFAEVDVILEEMPFERIKIYLRWCVLHRSASFLSEKMERRKFDFYGRTFSGFTEMKPLWRRALRTTNNALDELVGKLYVERHFSDEAKLKIGDLVDHLVVAYRARIEKLEWMGSETKKKAIEKLGAISKKLGYPDVWKDYTALVIKEDSFIKNNMRANIFEFHRKMKEVGGPENRDEWFMSPQMVNAYYQPPLNEIAFPAAILQPPFFDPNAEDATNFGGIGTVIGHELTHGFDDQGSRFDAHGNLNEWWTKEDKEQFDARAAQLVKQFDQYEPIPGVRLNGKLTLGENIADLGGLLIAYDALRLKLAEASAMVGEDGISPEQKFFINYAVTERGHIRDELVRLYAQTDSHSPSEFRVNGPLSNMEEFYNAFGCASGDKLWRESRDRVKIW